MTLSNATKAEKHQNRLLNSLLNAENEKLHVTWNIWTGTTLAKKNEKLHFILKIWTGASTSLPFWQIQ